MDFFADFDSEMGNGKSSDLITGDQQDEMDQNQSMAMDSRSPQDGLVGGQVISSDQTGQVLTSVHDGFSGHVGGVMNSNVDKSNNTLDNISGDSLANVESMDTSDLIQVPEETTNMMMEDFSDLVSNQAVSGCKFFNPLLRTLIHIFHPLVSSIQSTNQTSSVSSQQLQFDTSLNNILGNTGQSATVDHSTHGNVTGGRTIVMTTSGSSAQSVAASIARSSSSQPIIIPVSSNILSSPTALSEFINSIKPPVIPGSATVVKAPSSQIIFGTQGSSGQITIAPAPGTMRPMKMTTYSKKQPSIAPAPSMSISSLQAAINSGSIKIVNTPTGQQLLVTSPIKQEGGGTKMVTVPVSSGSSGGQVLFLSPLKQGVTTIKPGGLKTLAPAPMKVSIAPSGSVSNRPAVKQSSVQVVKVVQGNSTGKGTATLRPLAPSTSQTKTIQLTSAQLASLVSGASGEFSGGKVTIVQAPTSGAKASSTQTIQIGNQQLLIPSSGASGSNSQVIMLPAHLLQGLAGSGQFTIQTGPASGKSASLGRPLQNITLETPSRTTYVPIAPSPNTSSNIHPSTKDVLNKLTPTSRDVINQNG